MQGFEARGTILAQRLTAWTNLLDAAGSSGPLTINPRRIKAPRYNISQKVISKVSWTIWSCFLAAFSFHITLHNNSVKLSVKVMLPGVTLIPYILNLFQGVVLVLHVNLYQVCKRYQCFASTNSNHMHLLRDDKTVYKTEDLIEQTAIRSNSSGKLRYRFQIRAH